VYLAAGLLLVTGMARFVGRDAARMQAEMNQP
jgi:hypothetical protein